MIHPINPYEIVEIYEIIIQVFTKGKPFAYKQSRNSCISIVAL